MSNFEKEEEELATVAQLKALEERLLSNSDRVPTPSFWSQRATLMATGLVAGVVGGLIGAWYFVQSDPNAHPHTEFALKERFTTFAAATDTNSRTMTSLKERVEDMEIELSDLIGTVGAIDLSAATGLLETRILNLETDLNELAFVPSIGEHEETKAIIAFTSAKGEKTCPLGWEPFEPAKNRFVLGAGGQYPVVGSIGGEEQVTLSEAEMPNHGHVVNAVALNEYYPPNGGLGHTSPNHSGTENILMLPGGGQRSPTQWTGPAGSSQPHNNMPPYIALYFCQKS